MPSSPTCSMRVTSVSLGLSVVLLRFLTMLKVRMSILVGVFGVRGCSLSSVSGLVAQGSMWRKLGRWLLSTMVAGLLLMRGG